MSNFMFENSYFTINGYSYCRNEMKKIKFDFKKIEWKEENIEV